MVMVDIPQTGDLNLQMPDNLLHEIIIIPCCVHMQAMESIVLFCVTKVVNFLGLKGKSSMTTTTKCDTQSKPLDPLCGAINILILWCCRFLDRCMPENHHRCLREWYVVFSVSSVGLTFS